MQQIRFKELGELSEEGKRVAGLDYCSRSSVKLILGELAQTADLTVLRIVAWHGTNRENVTLSVSVSGREKGGLGAQSGSRPAGDLVTELQGLGFTVGWSSGADLGQ